MMNDSQIAKTYHEDPREYFTHNGKKYNMNKLFALAENRPVIELPIVDLEWIIKYSMEEINGELVCGSCKDGPVGWHEERVAFADLMVPVIVTKSNGGPNEQYAAPGKLVILDGLHRLKKSIRLKHATILARMVDEEELESCL